MPANTKRVTIECPYCRVRYSDHWVAWHVATSEHQNNVKKFKRSPQYRNRQSHFPFFDAPNPPERRR